MDFTRFRFMAMKFIKSEKGQTLVEYILLLSVAVSLTLTLYRSNAFQKLFGSKGSLGVRIKSQNEFAYRHAFSSTGPGRVRPADVSRTNKDGSIHPSYADTESGGTRFFGPKEAYGN